MQLLRRPSRACARPVQIMSYAWSNGENLPR
jgi:hypothetical protein